MNDRVKTFLFLSLSLIFIGSFLFLPKTGLAELNPEEAMESQGKIGIEEKESKLIFKSLLHYLEKRKRDAVLTNYNLEDQAVISLVIKGIKIEALNYWMIEFSKEVGKEIAKATLKTARLILTKDIGKVIEEIESVTVDRAKEYLMEWLLQEEIRVAPGNLNKISYQDYQNKWQEAKFSYIFAYKPLSSGSGEVGINIYSSGRIKTPRPSGGIQWEGGIEELPPFIIEISGEVEKVWVGAGYYYNWTAGPNIEIIFNQPVPEFEFKEIGFLEKQVNKFKSNFNKTKVAGEKLLEILKGISEKTTDYGKELGKGVYDKIKDFFSGLNPFQAALVPEITFYEVDDPGKEPIGDKEKENEDSEGEEDEEGEKEEENLLENLPDSPEPSLGEDRQKDLEDLLRKLNDLNEEIEDLKEGQKEDEETKEEEKDPEDDNHFCEYEVDLNTSPKEELVYLVGVGDVIAQRIIDYREKGSFYSVEDLLEISGIGSVTLQKIKEQGCVFVDGIGFEEEEEENEEKNDSRSGTGSIDDENPNYCDIPGSDPVKDQVIINEVAWMGTDNSSNNEWIELKNISDSAVSLSGWQVLDKEKQIKVIFDSGDLQPGEFYLLERTDDDSVPGIAADLIYTGGLNNNNEALYLFNNDCQLQDKVEADPDWPAGDNEEKRTMERGEDLLWHTFSGEEEGDIKGTPKAENSEPPESVSEPVLEIFPKELTFEVKEDEDSSSTKIISVNTSEQELEWTASLSPAADWLAIAPVSATSSEEVSVMVDPSELVSGSYSAEIVFLAGNSEERVAVELNIQPEDKLLDHIVISEIKLADNEFVELYNPKETEVNVSEWYFSYYPSTREEWNNPYRNKQFPENSVIPPQSHYLIGLKGYSDILGNPVSEWQAYASDLLGNSEGSVAIFPWDPEGKTSEEAENGRIDAVGWGDVEIKESESCDPAPKGKSLNRISSSQYQDTDLNSFDFEIRDDPTPTNSKGEIYYPPAAESFSWPMIQQNPQHTGQSKYELPQNLKEDWSLILKSHDSEERVYGSTQPVIGEDETIYFALRGDDWGALYAISSKGKKKWTYETTEENIYNPAIGADATVYFPTSGGSVYAINPDGTKKWEFSTGREEESDWAKSIYSVVIGDCHNIYFTDYQYLYSINSQGKLNWKIGNAPRGGSAFLGPAIGKDNTIYVTWTGFRSLQDSAHGSLRAYNPEDGSKKWQASLEYSATAPVVDSNGNIYIVAGWNGWDLGGDLYKFNGEGKKLWQKGRLDSYSTVPVLAPDGTITVSDNWTERIKGNSWGTFSSLKMYSSNGDTIGEAEKERNRMSQAQTDIGNNVIFSRNKEVFLLKNTDENSKKVALSANLGFSSPVIGKEGRVYIVGKEEKENSATDIILYSLVAGPDPEIEGCTDVEALNYNPEATIDDGSCQYDIEGCMDPAAENYNPEATIDDGSCIILNIKTESNSSPALDLGKESALPFSDSSASSGTESISSTSTKERLEENNEEEENNQEEDKESHQKENEEEEREKDQEEGNKEEVEPLDSESATTPSSTPLSNSINNSSTPSNILEEKDTDSGEDIDPVETEIKEEVSETSTEPAN